MKKNIVAALLVAALSLGNMSPAHASKAATGDILDFWAMPNGIILFNQSGVRTAAPGCQNLKNSKRWAIDGSTPAGQASVAALLTAYSLGKQIFIWGTESCTYLGDAELVSFFAISHPVNGNGTDF